MTDSQTLDDGPGRVKRVLVVDDHPMMRSGITQLISEQGDFEVCGEAGDLEGAIAQVTATQPDLITLDLTLGIDSSLFHFDRLREAKPGLPILVISMHDELVHGHKAILAKANGYVQKEASSDEIVAALRLVADGKTAISPQLAALFIETSSNGRPAENELGLSNREFEVYQKIGVGLATREIAGQLGISPRTVEAHKENIKKKLGLGTAAELAKRAAQFMQGPSPARG